MRSPARSFDAVSGDDLGAAEGGFANHFSSVWVRILDGLQVLFHDSHFVDVFEQPFNRVPGLNWAIPA